MFLKLRSAVQLRYSDVIDYKQYEGQIAKLVSQHVESGEVQIITKLVNIFDKEKFEEEVSKVNGNVAKADTIASRTSKFITENMESDPAFYKKFSQMLKETIAAYQQGRIDEAEHVLRQALSRIHGLRGGVRPAGAGHRLDELLVEHRCLSAERLICLRMPGEQGRYRGRYLVCARSGNSFQ